MALDESIRPNGNYMFVSLVTETVVTDVPTATSLGVIELAYFGSIIFNDGDYILFESNQAKFFTNNGTKYYIVPEKSILLTYPGALP